MKTLIAVGLVSFLAGPALAGGFYLPEQSPASVGRAFSGEAAIANDASTIAFNPAGMTKLGKLTFTNGAHAIFIDNGQSDRGTTRTLTATGDTTATGGGDGGNPFARVVPLPAAYGAMRVGDSPLWLGMGVTAPFGLKVVYEPDWFGRYDSITSDLKTFNVQPSAAYALSDRFSIGVGANIQYIEAKLTNALPNPGAPASDGLLSVKGDDVSFGWNAGVLADLGDVRLGAHYRSRIEHRLSGTLTVSGLQGGLAAGNGRQRMHAPVNLPDIAMASIVLGARGPSRLMASASWYNWSVFKEIRIVPAAGAARVSPQNYKDTWSASIGAEHDLRPGLTLRGGLMRDGGPTQDGFRTTRVAGGDRSWMTAGASIALTGHMTMDLAYAHVFVKDALVNRTDTFFADTSAETVTTTRSRDRTDIDMLALAVTARF